MKFDGAPYNNDFDENENHYSVLFKPGKMVQARELNVLQSMAQNQVTSIGDHLFKNGSKISGCSSSFVQYDYVALKDNTEDLTDVVGKRVIGSSSGVEANIVKYVGAEDNDPDMLLIVYNKTGIDNIQSSFVPGETLEIFNNSDILTHTLEVRCQGCTGDDTENDEFLSVGKSMLFTLDEGIFYYSGYFVKVQKQDILISRYVLKDSSGFILSSEAYRVGLDVIEEIVTCDNDKSLLDPHFGYDNFGAPGADRFKISMKLSIRDYNDERISNFIMLSKVRQNHTVEYKKDDTEYAEIMKEFARRTYEANGNYTIVPWKTKFLNEKKTSVNDMTGWILSGSDSKYVAVIQPGCGYVKGYRVENKSEVVVSANKARNALVVDEFVQLGINSNIIVSIDTFSDWNKQDVFEMKDSLDAVIGEFKVIDILILPDNKAQLFFIDLSFESGKNISLCETVTSVAGFVGTISGTINSKNKTDLLYDTGFSNVKSLVGSRIIFHKKFEGTLDVDGILSITGGTNEEFVPNSDDVFIIDGNLTEYESIAYGPDITIDFGSAHSNETYSCYLSVKAVIEPIEKTSIRHEYTATTVSGTFASILTLEHGQVHVIDDIVLDRGSEQISVKSKFKLDYNQGPTSHPNSKIIQVGQNDWLPTDSLIISYYYLEDGTTGNVFTVDSYAEVEYENIPTYNGKKVSEYLDFRGIETPKSGSIAELSVENYLDKIDLLQVNTAGAFYIKEGVPSKNPRAPYPDEDAMALYEIHVGAYTYRLSDIKVKYLDNKIYNSKAVDALVERINKIEDAIALSALEKNTLDMSIKDQNGMDRYKNGFIVDNFKGYYAADITNTEFKGALDRNNGILRPEFKQNNIKLKFDITKSKNIKLIGGVALPNYNHDLFITNPFATQTLSINPYMISKRKGTLTLSPNIDTWADSTNLPAIVSDIDAGVGPLKELASANKLLSTDFGSWVDFNTSTVTDIKTEVISTPTKITTNNLTTSTSTTKSSRTVSNKDVISSNQTYSINDMVKDVSLIPYIREKTIQFYASNLKPNTRVYAYFDSQDVTKHCRSIIDLSDDTDIITKRNAAIFGGLPLVSDSIGNISGEFRIPGSTFFVGQKNFVLTNDPNNSGNPDVETTMAETVYFAAGIAQTRQTETMNIITPSFSISTSEETRTTVKTSTETSTTVKDVPVVVIPPAPPVIVNKTPPPQINFFGVTWASGNNHEIKWEVRFADEVKLFSFPGQTTFRVDNNKLVGQWKGNYVSGNYILSARNTKTGEETSSQFTLLRNLMITGSRTGNTTPAPNPIRFSNFSFNHDPIAQGFKVDTSCFISKVGVYFSEVDMKSSSVWFEIREMINGYPSDKGIGRKEVKPSELSAYISENGTTEYQVEFPAPIYVDSTRSYAFVIGGFSPDTRVFISRLGEKLIQTDKFLEQPPLPYTMFRSLNGETWNAEQFTTLKINIYRASFISDETSFSFGIENDDFSLICEADPIEVQPNTNRVRIYAKNHGLRVNDRFVLDLNSDVYYKVEVIEGMPQIGQPISTVTGSGYIKNIKILPTLNFYEISIERTIGSFLPDQEFICESRKVEYRDLFLISDTGAKGAPIVQKSSVGYIRGLAIAGSFPDKIAGVDSGLISKEHIVRDVDSIDSLVIEVEAQFTASGRFGGTNVLINDCNIKYDMINVSGQYMNYACKDNWMINGVDGNTNDYNESISIFPKTDYPLNSSQIILSDRNESRILGKDKSSFSLDVSTRLHSPYVAPVFNVDSFSVTTVSNRVEKIDVNVYDKLPVGPGRFKLETNGVVGSESFKYITTSSVLENPAVDMKILFDAHCPSVADFEVYVKTIKPQNTAAESSIDWVKVDKFTIKKSTNNVNDYTQYDLLLSTHCSNWTSLDEYIGYRVKIVGKSTNSCLPPMFKNFRAIAIT